jgi:hypothetical protein
MTRRPPPAWWPDDAAATSDTIPAPGTHPLADAFAAPPPPAPPPVVIAIVCPRVPDHTLYTFHLGEWPTGPSTYCDVPDCRCRARDEGRPIPADDLDDL